MDWAVPCHREGGKEERSRRAGERSTLLVSIAATGGGGGGGGGGHAPPPDALPSSPLCEPDGRGRVSKSGEGGVRSAGWRGGLGRWWKIRSSAWFSAAEEEDGAMDGAGGAD